MLERDVNALDITAGYIPTPRSLQALRQVQNALLTPGMARAFTVTAVYGTGKSAFAQFLVALLCGNEPARKTARAALHGSLLRQFNPHEVASDNQNLKKPFTAAVVAASREPLLFTLLRALGNAVTNRVPGLKTEQLPALAKSLNETTKYIRQNMHDTERFHKLLKQFAAASHSGMVLVIDEFGKSLEYAAQHRNEDGAADIYLLQQLAELRELDGKPLAVITLLHQAFSEYGDGLSRDERAEWAKIQGRFEDLPLQESEVNALPLLASAIVQKQKIRPDVKTWGAAWRDMFQSVKKQYPSFAALSEVILGHLYPLHPVSARLLPALAARYAQNERSVFTFLTGPEELALPHFLNSTMKEGLPTVRPARLYDYFSESMGTAISMQSGYSRWVEVQDIIKDGQFLPEIEQELLKTIGLLNLLSTSGDLRAGRELVIASLLDNPQDRERRRAAENALTRLEKKGLLNYRAGADEYRLWQGSLFDVDSGLREELSRDFTSLAGILNENFPFPAQVAQRHSFQTGTLRYFFRLFWDGDEASFEELNKTLTEETNCDGFVIYALKKPGELPQLSQFFLPDGRPLVIISSEQISQLLQEARHYAALARLAGENSALRDDKIARREVNARLVLSEESLIAAVEKVFRFDDRNTRAAFYYHHKEQGSLSDLDGEKHITVKKRGLGALLSEVCDQAYNLNLLKPKLRKLRHYTLKNELINRREIGSGISKALRTLAMAMLANPREHRFGLTGNGPEITIYATLFERTGLHRGDVAGVFGFYHPTEDSGLQDVYAELEGWCKSATQEARPLEEIYNKLLAPPFGVRQYVLPMLLMAVLLKHPETMNLYREGSFVPVLNIETFEILLRRPEKFAVKYFRLDGLKNTFFKELEKIFFAGNLSPEWSMASQSQGRSGLLKVIKPLVKNIAALPRYTRTTQNVSGAARELLKTILSAKEPDTLLFYDLPKALGLPLDSNLEKGSDKKEERARQLSKATQEALKELEDAYPRLLRDIRRLLAEAFQTKQETLRAYLNLAGSRLLPTVIEPELKRFAKAAAETHSDEVTFFESLAMVIADKPTQAWLDHDFAIFETRLKEIARRVLNLEVVLAEARRHHEGAFDARLLTLTASDGTELRGALVVPEDSKLLEKIEQFLAEHEELTGDPRQLHALILKLSDKAFGEKKAPKPKEKPDKKKILETG